MNDKWQKDVEINPNTLDVEWCKQASLVGEYCVAQAEARAKLDLAKEAVDVTAAKLGLKIRANPASYGLDKVTEASVQAVILLDTTYAVATQALRDAQYEYDVLSAAVRALDQKKSALENLVRLQGQNYFAGPSAPRDLGAEWVKDCERRNARDKVRQAVGRAEPVPDHQQPQGQGKRIIKR